MKREKFFGILLSFALVMVIVLLPGMSLTAIADPDGVGIDVLPSEGGTYYLTADIEISTTWNVTGNTTLDLNGYGIIMTGNERVINVPDTASLTINDSGTTTHYYSISSPESNTGAGLANVGSGSMSFTGGYITGGNAYPQFGGGIYVSGSLTLNGGTIIGNQAYSGGGVKVLGNNAVFTMNGGNIIGNLTNGDGGAGVSVGHDQNKGVMKLSGGIIQYNYTYTGNNSVGGGIRIYEGGLLRLTGGTVANNYAEKRGGGIGEGNIEIMGAPVVRDNYADGKQYNVNLYNTNYHIKLIGPLTGNSLIGVMINSGNDPQSGKFTENWNTYMSEKKPSDYFTTDFTNYIVTSDGSEGALGVRGNEYTVTYKPNDGEGTMTDENSPYGKNSTVKVLPNEFTRTGYNFSAWNTKADGTGTQYVGGESFSITEDTVLFAQWSEISPIPPTINEQPQSLDLTYGYTDGTICVTASAEDGHQLSYQWYSNTTKSNEGGTVISEATSASYVIPTGKNAGITEYYYCVITATRTETGKTSAITSDVATVTVNKASAPDLTDAQKSKSKELTYTGEPQQLVTPPSEHPEGYEKVQYSIDGGKTWTDEVPTGTDVGSYTVKVRYIGDENHEDFPGDDIPVVIQPEGTPTLTEAQKPKANELSYTGEPQKLVTPPTELPEGYEKVQYSIDGGETWTDDVPTGTEAGEYTVKVKYVGDENHTTFEGADVPVTIQPGATPTLTDAQKPTANELTYNGETQKLVIPPTEKPEGYEKVQYSIDGGKTWTDDVPTGTEAGNYTVKVKYVADKNHTDFNGEDIQVTIGQAPMELTVQTDNLKQDASRGVPSEIKDQEVEMTITIKSDTAEAKTVKPMKLNVSAGNVTVTEPASFDKAIEDLGPGKQTVIVEVTPKTVYKQSEIYSGDEPVAGPVEWKYDISAKGEINEVDGKMIVRIYLIWDNGSRPELIRVVALPEDEIGAYKLNADGTKEYLLFHTYDICMKWLGSDELCRGYERCFHKENAFVNPFVKP